MELDVVNRTKFTIFSSLHNFIQIEKFQSQEPKQLE